MKNAADDGLNTCPHCGANRYASASRCWMCYSDLGKEPEFFMAEVVAEPPRQSLSEAFFATLTIMAIGFVVVVGIGVAMQEPMQAAVYAAVAAVPLTACAVRLQNKKCREGSLRWSERFVTLMLSAVVSYGIFILLILAVNLVAFALCMSPGKLLDAFR